MSARIYLDHAATTPLLPAAREAMAEGFARWANPSSPHAEGRAAKAALEAARGQVAAAYGWAGEVLFTSGASESLSIALTRSTVERRLAGAVEHDAVLRAAYDIALIKVGADGLVDGDALDAAMAGEGRAVVAIQWANSETGVRQPIAALAERVHAAGHLLLVDAAQMPAGADRDVARHADFVALSAHKRGGPIGVGALLVRDLATLDPTGGQERGYRPGTENMPAILGYAAALAEPEDVARYAELRRYLDDAMTSLGAEPVLSGALRHPAIGSYRLPGVAATTQLIRLDMAGIAVSAGSACASGSMKPSHVLTAMGWDQQAAQEVVRVSFGRSTTQGDLDTFIAVWRDIVAGRSRAA
ncbi:MAG: aminotransferase class V-fold PLP-dependent enzyme [Sphingomonas sp.]|uniref:cysteine desulfurase family protein n=1 Tax=Sphingomonas sp. TaxID=28214 RepID=UPI001AC23D4B|nr:aminotransferase class V-fold PLP-dependent enzyme [Sphingomonas sp.]MBN8814958.1 aminotransferase class V-fold PLP-dependent enzyme [Sphingomonas sp.]